MRRGKEIAQGAHASLAAILNKGAVEQGKFVIDLDSAMEAWLTGSFTKICVSANSEDELLDLHQQAQKLGLNCALIQDSGKTEFNGVPTYTTCAIGPNDAKDIDPITGHLKLK